MNRYDIHNNRIRRVTEAVDPDLPAGAWIDWAADESDRVPYVVDAHGVDSWDEDDLENSVAIHQDKMADGVICDPDPDEHYSADHEVWVRADWTQPSDPIEYGVADAETGAVLMWMATVYQVADCAGREDAAARVHAWTAGQCG